MNAWMEEETKTEKKDRQADRHTRKACTPPPLTRTPLPPYRQCNRLILLLPLPRLVPDTCKHNVQHQVGAGVSCQALPGNSTSRHPPPTTTRPPPTCRGCNTRGGVSFLSVTVTCRKRLYFLFHGQPFPFSATRGEQLRFLSHWRIIPFSVHFGIVCKGGLSNSPA